MSEMVQAAEALANIGPAISLFGSARIKTDSPYYEKSEKIARLLAKAGFTVIAGGGPGIMEAANKGAFEAGEPVLACTSNSDTRREPTLF